MTPFQKAPLLCFLFLLFVGITACEEDEKKYPDTQRAVPLNKDDKRYAEEATLFTLSAQEGILRFHKDSACYMIYPNSRTSSFRETLLPIRLPSIATICQAIDWILPIEEFYESSIIYSGEVKSKKGIYYPIVLTELKFIVAIPLTTPY